MCIAEIVQDFEVRKQRGHYDEVLWQSASIPANLTDDEIEGMNGPASLARARLVFNEEFIAAIAKRFPDAFNCDEC